MKKFKISKKVVLKYNMIEEFPEFFEKRLKKLQNKNVELKETKTPIILVPGTWYTVSDLKGTFLPSQKAVVQYRPDNYCIGFNFLGEYTNTFMNLKDVLDRGTDTVEYVTEMEVKQAFMKEVEKRDFRKGFCFKFKEESLSNEIRIVDDVKLDFYYFFNKKHARFNTIYIQNYVIYDNGVWATAYRQ